MENMSVLYSHDGLLAWRLCMMALKVHDIADESTGNGTGNLLAARNSHLGWRPVWKKTLHLAIGIEIQMWDTCFVGKKPTSTRARQTIQYTAKETKTHG